MDDGDKLVELGVPVAGPAAAGQLWTVQDLADFVGCSVRHVSNLRAAGLPTIRLGRMVRFEPDAVMAWLRGGRR